MKVFTLHSIKYAFMNYYLRNHHLICLAIMTTICLSAVVGCAPTTEEIVINYPTGEISRKHTEINGRKEGVMTDYYKDGKVKSERLFKADMQTGRSVIYYPNGNIKKVQYFEHGKVHGGDTLFYENGKPQFLRNYNKGMIDGYIRKWNLDDSIIYEARYKNDTLIEVKGESVDPDTTINK